MDNLPSKLNKNFQEFIWLKSYIFRLRVRECGGSVYPVSGKVCIYRTVPWYQRLNALPPALWAYLGKNSHKNWTPSSFLHEHSTQRGVPTAGPDRQSCRAVEHRIRGIHCNTDIQFTLLYRYTVYSIHCYTDVQYTLLYRCTVYTTIQICSI